MKPNVSNSQDPLGKLLDEAWEPIPVHLEQHLVEMPKQLQNVRQLSVDKLISQRGK